MTEWALAALLVLGAPGPKDKPADPPPGEWEAVSFVYKGKPIGIGPKESSPIYMRFTRTTWVQAVPAIEWERIQDVSFSEAKGVLRMDLRLDDPERAELGIWKVEEGTLTICMSTPGKPRPTEFTCPAGSDRILWVLKRVKKD